MSVNRFLFLLVLFSYGLMSQTPTLNITYPSNEQLNVELYPTFKIESSVTFDTTSIKAAFPYSDSVFIGETNPSIFLYQNMQHDSISDEVYKRAATLFGKYKLLDQYTLLFTPFRPLDPNIEYTFQTNNLKGLVASEFGIDTVILDNQVITFNTVPYSHSVKFCNLGNTKFLHCTDTITTRFNRRINGLNNSNDDIFSLKVFENIQVEDDSIFTGIYSDVSIHASYDENDSSIIHIVNSSGYEPGRDYTFNINLSNLTGDKNDDREYRFRGKEYFRVTIAKAPKDTTFSLPDTIRTYPFVPVTYHRYSDTLDIFAQSKCGIYEFEKWECTQNEYINNNTDNYLRLGQDCESIKDLDITAVYKKLDTIKVTVRDSMGIVCRVYNSGLNYLGGAGDYFLGPDDFIYLNGENTEDSTVVHTFSCFQATGITLEDPNEAIRRIYNHGEDVIFFPVGLDEPIDNPCIKAACISLESNGEKICNLEDLVDISPSKCRETGYDEGWVSFTVSLKPGAPDCFKIAGVNMPGAGQDIRFTPMVRSCSFQVWSKCSKPTAMVFIDNSECRATLNVYTEIDKSKLAYPDSYNPIGKEVQTIIEVFDYCGNNIKYDLSEPKAKEFPYKAQYSNETFILLKGYTVKLTPITNRGEEDGYEFKEWLEDPAFKYPAPKTAWPFTFIIGQDVEQVMGTFTENFRLRKVGFHINDDRNNITWFTTKQLQTMMPEDIDVYNYTGDTEDGYGAKVYFMFNDYPKTSAETDYLNRIICEDKSERVDDPTFGGHNSLLYQYRLDENNIQLDPNNNRILSMQLKHSWMDKQIPKGEEFLISLFSPMGTKLHNTLEYQLYKGYNFIAETELPGVALFWESVNALRGADDLDDLFLTREIEFRSSYSSGIDQPPNVIHTNSGAIPGFTLLNDYIGTNNFYSIITWLDEYKEMYKDYVFWFQINSEDIDAAEWNIPIWIQIGVAIALSHTFPGHEDESSPVKPGAHHKPLGLSLGIAAVASMGIELIVQYYGRPDTIGEGYFLYTWQDKWFGAHPSKFDDYSPFVSNILRYKFKIKLSKTEELKYHVFY